MPYLIGSIALIIALTAIILVFYDMYKAFRQDLADFNHSDTWDVTLTELDHIHTDSSHSVIVIQIILISGIQNSELREIFETFNNETIISSSLATFK